jgi:hypothetical protein
MNVGEIVFNAALNAFVEDAQAIIDKHMEENFPTLDRPTLTVDKGGRKYLRIVRNERGQGRSVHCFVEKETGNILKAAGWAAPAKHARGNIYNENAVKCMGPYGAAYLR